MIMRFQIAAVFAAFLFGTSTLCLAQDDIIIGGFGKASTTDEQVGKAANFAVLTQNQRDKNTTFKLVSILKADQQVVAGMNYRMCLSLSTAGKSQQASATVFRNLKNQFSLSAWKVGTCSAMTSTVFEPEALVKSLYGAEKAGKNPFFQIADRKLIDRYFTKELSDLIWNDSVFANGELGAIDFDPLYDAQDTTITNFLIGKSEYDKMSGAATVSVSFRNFGKPQTVTFLLTKENSINWKIMDIVYESGSTLKGLLTSLESQESTEDN